MLIRYTQLLFFLVHLLRNENNPKLSFMHRTCIELNWRK